MNITGSGNLSSIVTYSRGYTILFQYGYVHGLLVLDIFKFAASVKDITVYLYDLKVVQVHSLCMQHRLFEGIFLCFGKNLQKLSTSKIVMISSNRNAVWLGMYVCKIDN